MKVACFIILVFALLVAAPAGAATISIDNIPLGKVISLNGQKFTKIKNNSTRGSQFIALASTCSAITSNCTSCVGFNTCTACENNLTLRNNACYQTQTATATWVTDAYGSYIDFKNNLYYDHCMNCGGVRTYYPNEGQYFCVGPRICYTSYSCPTGWILDGTTCYRLP